MRLTTTFAFAAVIFGLSLASAQDVISVNFQGNEGGAGNVTGIAGFVPVGNWNNAVGGPIPNAVNDLNVTTGASISWSASGQYGSSVPTNGANGSLMAGYLDNFGGGTITVTNLPSNFVNNGYSVYVYHSTDSAGVQGYSIADNATNTDTAFGRQAGGDGTNFPLGGPPGFVVSTDTTNSGATTASNVILLEGLSGSSFTITGINGAFGDGRARPNGFQIVALAAAVPEPASIAAWLTIAGAVAGLAYFRLRRKSK